jgi:hypothetical protein
VSRINLTFALVAGTCSFLGCGDGHTPPPAPEAGAGGRPIVTVPDSSSLGGALVGSPTAGSGEVTNPGGAAGTSFGGASQSFGGAAFGGTTFGGATSLGGGAATGGALSGSFSGAASFGGNGGQ